MGLKHLAVTEPLADLPIPLKMYGDREWVSLTPC